MIFCCKECCPLPLLKKWEALCKAYFLSPGKLSAKLRKEIYRQTDKGKLQRKRESKKHYNKRKATKAKAKVQASEDRILPDPRLEEVSEKPLEADTLVSPVPANEVTMSEQPELTKEVSAPEQAVSPGTPEAEKSSAIASPSPAVPPKTESPSAKYRTILKNLFSGKPEQAVLSPEEAVSTPPGVIPCVCKRPGCDAVVIPRSVETEKRFCSHICMNAFRNTFQTLKEAWKATRCSFLKLLITLFKLL